MDKKPLKIPPKSSVSYWEEKKATEELLVVFLKKSACKTCLLIPSLTILAKKSDVTVLRKSVITG